MHPFRFILSLVFPAQCVSCRNYENSDSLLCNACAARVPLRNAFLCAVCGARLPDGKKICHRDAPYILAAAADSREPVKTLVQLLKFQGVRDAATPLAALLVRYGEERALTWHPSPADLVIPVPLGKKRTRTRGFNQAELIAKAFAEHFGGQFRPDILSRIRETAPQSELHSHDARERNIIGAFSATEENLLRGARVILVDDVATSGATLNDAARALKSRGVRTILAFVVARA